MVGSAQMRLERRESQLPLAARASTTACALVWLGVALLGAAASIPHASAAGAALSPRHLRCEYLVDPLGLDETHPRLSWMVESIQRGQRQTAYQIMVAREESRLLEDHCDLWDSGKVSNSDTTGIVYAGKKLRSRERYYWKVRVWDKDGNVSSWSTPATWTMGLLEPDDWKARFISYRDTTPLHRFADPLFLPPAHQYRREFNCAKRVKRATLYITALGIYEGYVNGQRVGDAYFAPGWTDYHQRA